MTEYIPGRAPKVHPPELCLPATEAANIAGMEASGQPWQEDAAGRPTAELLAEPHPGIPVPITALDPEDIPAIDPPDDAHGDESGAEGTTLPVLPETVAELREALTAGGIEYPARALKAELEQLYAETLGD